MAGFERKAVKTVKFIFFKSVGCKNCFTVWWD